jgi:hypothetical protein
MPIIFDKNDPDYSIYEDALGAWEKSGKNDEQAMAVNMRFDHRVTRARELVFRKYFKTPNKNPRLELTKALLEHWINEIRSKAVPEFCNPVCDNAVVDCSKAVDRCCIGFDEDVELATVISLNGYLEPIKNTSHKVSISIPEWKEFEDIDTLAVDYRSNLDIWLNTYLENNYLKKGGDPKKIEPFIDVVFKILNYRLSKGLYYQPVWVTKWKDLEKYTKINRTDGTLDVDRWNQVVGVPRNPSSWQIIIKYPASAVKCLHRPSILDGGYIYGQHFPSPPRIPMSIGGHTMDLGKSDDKLMSEFIHPQIPLKLEYWTEAGGLIGKTLTAGYYGLLSDNRIAHHQKLINKYGEKEIKDWMPSPV